MMKSSVFEKLVHLIEKNQNSPEKTSANHPKLNKLSSILIEHFERHEQGNKSNTKVIVFSQFRSSVTEILNTLSTSHALIKVSLCAEY